MERIECWQPGLTFCVGCASSELCDAMKAAYSSMLRHQRQSLIEKGVNHVESC